MPKSHLVPDPRSDHRCHGRCRLGGRALPLPMQCSLQLRIGRRAHGAHLICRPMPSASRHEVLGLPCCAGTSRRGAPATMAPHGPTPRWFSGRDIGRHTGHHGAVGQTRACAAVQVYILMSSRSVFRRIPYGARCGAPGWQSRMRRHTQAWFARRAGRGRWASVDCFFGAARAVWRARAQRREPGRGQVKHGGHASISIHPIDILENVSSKASVEGNQSLSDPPSGEAPTMQDSFQVRGQKPKWTQTRSCATRACRQCSGLPPLCPGDHFTMPGL